MEIERNLTRLRLVQPIAELARKANKAHRKGHWTQEDRDLAIREAMQKGEEFVIKQRKGMRSLLLILGRGE